MRKWYLSFVFAFIFSLLGISIGSADFLIQSVADFNKDTGKAEMISEKPVCYSYENGKTAKNYYTSLAAALDATYNNGNDKTAHTIVMIPGSYSTVYSYSGTHYLGNNDTLILPYSGDESYYDKSEDKSSSDTHPTGWGSFADNFADSYRRMQLKFADDAVLNISSSSKLYVGGIVGNPSPQGATCKDYAEILMGKDSKIINNGAIECYGFIKETENDCSTIVNQNGGSFKITMIEYDWESASTALSKKEAGVFPLEKYEFVNCRSRMTFDSTATFYGIHHSFGDNAGTIISEATVYGTSNAMFLAGENAYIEYKFSDSSSLITTSVGESKHTNEIIAKGKITLGGINVQVKRLFVTYPINSTDFYLPIPETFSIYLDDGEFTIPNRVKFLPGSSLTVGKNETLNLNANTMFYQSNKYGSYSMKSSTYSKASTFINNGTLNINSGFGGQITTNSSISKVVTGSSFAVPDDCYEYNSGAVGPFAFPATADLFTSSTASKTDNLSAGYTYLSDLTSVDDTYAYRYNGSIEFINLTDSGSSVTATNSNSTSFTYNDVSVTLAEPTCSDSGLSFAGYFYDSSFSKPLSTDSLGNYYYKGNELLDYMTSGNVKIYAKWTKLSKYTITFKYHDGSISSRTFVENSSISISDINSGENYSYYYTMDAYKNSSNVCLYYTRNRYDAIGFSGIDLSTYKVTGDATLEVAYGDAVDKGQYCTIKYSTHDQYTLTLPSGAVSFNGENYYPKNQTVSGTVKSTSSTFLVWTSYTQYRVSWKLADGTSGAEDSSSDSTGDVVWSFELASNVTSLSCSKK